MENTENISLPEANHDDVTSVNGSVASPDVPADNDAAALAELIDKHPLLAQLVADIASGKVDINDFDETLAITTESPMPNSMPLWLNATSTTAGRPKSAAVSTSAAPRRNLFRRKNW